MDHSIECSSFLLNRLGSVPLDSAIHGDEGPPRHRTRHADGADAVLCCTVLYCAVLSADTSRFCLINCSFVLAHIVTAHAT